MDVLIELKCEDAKRFTHIARFEASRTDTVALLSACAAMFYGDRGRITIEDVSKPWVGELQLGGDQLPFERFMQSISNGIDP